MAGITLLRLYPSAWRERYGDEFAELLAGRPPSVRDRFDILTGAIDARLHPQVGADATRETALRHDRSLGALLVLAGALFTAWAGLGLTHMTRWDSGEVPADPDLVTIAWVSGMVGSILVAVALLGVALRYDWSIGPSGAVGGVLTGSGIVFASIGGGLLALALLGGGTLLMAWRVRGRILGTVSSVILATVTSLLVAAFLVFVSGDGQEPGWLLIGLLYGPAWVLVGLDLHAPSTRTQLVGA